jgi:hypothetical protein
MMITLIRRMGFLKNVVLKRIFERKWAGLLLYDTNIVISDLVVCSRDGFFLYYLTEEQ